MVIEYKNLIINLEENIKKLISQNKELKSEMNTLVDDLHKSKQELMLAHKDILDLQSKYDNLKIARTLSGDSEDVKHSQERISKLVREINKCIALLNQQ
jgi:DNA anti-recombination protein RmuC